VIEEDDSDIRKIKAVFWNNAARILSDISEGDILRIKGYLRKNKGEVELSVNHPSDMEVLEKNSAEVEFTPVSKLEPLVHSSIKGRISGFGDVKNFKKKMLAELYISDDTGRVRLILWEDKVSIYRKADIGDIIEIYNGYPKVGWDGEMEVHCGWNCTTMLRRV
jgi:replication factor A1